MVTQKHAVGTLRHTIAGAVFLWSFRTHAIGPSPPLPRLAVIELDSDDVEREATVLSDALRATIRASPRWSLLENSQPLTTLLIGLRCPPKPDAPCLQKIGDQIEADQFIWGTLKRGGTDQLVGEIHLWVRGQPEKVLQESYNAFPDDDADETLHRTARHIIEKLTNEEIDSPDAAPAIEPQLPPFDPVVRDPPEATGDQPPPPRPIPVRRIVSYASLSVGVLGVSLGAYEGLTFLSARNDLDRLRSQIPSSIRNVCKSSAPYAVDACAYYESADQARTLAVVFTSIGVAALAVGTVLLLVDPSRPKAASGAADRRFSRWRVDPYVSLGAAGMQVDATF